MSFARCSERSLERSSLTGIGAVLRHGEVLHDVKHGKSGDPLAIGRKLVHGPAAVGGGDGLDPLRLEVAKIFQGMHAAVGVEELNHSLGHGAVVIGVPPMS